MTLKKIAPAIFAVVLSGCGSIGAIGFPPMQRDSGNNVDSVAVSPVESATLPPVYGGTLPNETGVVGAAPPSTIPGGPPGPIPGGIPGAAPGVNPGLPGGTQTASVNQPAGNASNALGRTDLLGGWTVASSGDTCQLFMTLTSWTGGYRASTRGCNSDVLKSISAWNIHGTQVVLAGSGGSSVATLLSSGNGRFDGQTDQGDQIIFYR